jgi:formylmethanofuran dehydrogenase subunit B
VTAGTIEHAVCLGCGCACDDIEVVVRDGRIASVRNACPVGLAWYGDGTTTTLVKLRGSAVGVDAAAAEVAKLLRTGPAMVYLAPDLTTEAQRAAIALADRAGARLDSVTSDTAASGLVAGQRRGRATATLGEIRNRADVLVFWAVDPDVRYPRFLSRYALDPVGTQVPDGAAGRKVVAVDVGDARGAARAGSRVALALANEAAALAVMRATVMGRALGGLSPALEAAAELARQMMGARYVVLVHDAEPSSSPADPQRAEGLTGLAQALNGPTRCVLSSLRGGGNRSGADSAMTWQTGFPFAVDFSSGAPRYRAEEPASTTVTRMASVLIVGAVRRIPDEVARGLAGRRVAVIGPRASDAPFATEVAIDTGVAGIHEAGIGYRLDDVPLPVPQIVAGPISAVAALQAVAAALRSTGAA